LKIIILAILPLAVFFIVYFVWLFIYIFSYPAIYIKTISTYIASCRKSKDRI